MVPPFTQRRALRGALVPMIAGFIASKSEGRDTGLAGAWTISSLTVCARLELRRPAELRRAVRRGERE